MSNAGYSMSDLLLYSSGAAYTHYFEGDLSKKVSVGGVQLETPTPREALKLSTIISEEMCAEILDEVHENKVSHVYGLATLEPGLIVAYDPKTNYGSHEYMESADSVYIVSDVERGRRNDRVKVQLVCLKTGNRFTVLESGSESQTETVHDDTDGITNGYFDKITNETERYTEEKLDSIGKDLTSSTDKSSLSELLPRKKIKNSTKKSSSFLADFTQEYDSKSLPIQYIPDELLIDVLGLHSQVVAEKI